VINIKNSATCFGSKGTIIRPNMKTQSWYIQSAHTLNQNMSPNF